MRQKRTKKADTPPQTEAQQPKPGDQALIVKKVDDVALIVTSPHVVAIATRLGWHPTTLIRRVEAALPSKVEQHAFLQMGPDFRIHPESFAKLLRLYLGNRQLSSSDLQEHQVSARLVRSTMSDIGDYIENALDLLEKISADIAYYHLRMSMTDAGTLTIAYGNGALDIIQDIVGNLDVVRHKMHINQATPDRVVLMSAIKRIIRWIDEGRVIPSDILETFE